MADHLAAGPVAVPADANPSAPVRDSRCVFTTLIGRYEPLAEQPTAHASSIPHICLTDDPELRSGTWQIRIVAPAIDLDPIRSQRDLKVRPHLYLPEFERSLYIDNTVELTAPAEELFALLPAEASLGLVPHSFRETVLDEFLAVSKDGLDDQGRIFEQLNHYQISASETLDERPWWTGLMLRRHAQPAVGRLGELWYAHVLRYSRRDQLSLNVALRGAGLEPYVLDFDNHASSYHRWGQPSTRDRTGIRRPAVSMMPPPARIRAAELAVAERAARVATVEARLAALEADLARESARGHRLQAALVACSLRSTALERELDETRSIVDAALTSTSWRLTAPARRVGSLVRGALRAAGHPGNQVRAAVARLQHVDLGEEAYYGYFELVYRMRRLAGGQRLLPAGPDQVTRPYLLWKVAKLLGVDIVPLGAERTPLSFHFHDTTTSSIDPPSSGRVLNGACRDISKRRVEHAMVATFGYGVAVDPATHHGPMVEKSDRNAAHDGMVIQGPISRPDPKKVYQRVVDNEVEPGVVEDLRAAVVARRVAIVFRKQRRIDERFADTNELARPVPTRAVFSLDECQRIIDFAGFMGLDLGMLDIVRDRGDGRIYVLDVNNTPFAPPKAAPTLSGIRAIHRIARQFEREWGKLLV